MEFVSHLSFSKGRLLTVFGAAALTILTTNPVSAAPPEENVQCILGQPGAPNGLQCTANDTTLSSPTVAIIKPCNFPGDTAELNVTVDITVGAQTRYDLGVWLSVDGDPNADGSETGICSVLTVPNNAIHVDQLTSTFGDGDSCGDVFNVAPDGVIVPPAETAHILGVDLGSVDLLCLDSDGDGKINVPVIVAWEQQSNNNCSVSSEALPGTGSKCVADDSLSLDIPIPALLIVNKNTVPDDPQAFSFQLIGPDSGFVGGFDGDFTFPLTDNGVPADATWNSGATTFVGGLPADLAGSAYSLVETDPAGWVSTGSCTSDVDGTNLDPATLVLRPGETVTCDFVNLPNTGQLTIRKQTVGIEGSFDFDISDGGGSVANFSLDTTGMNPIDSTPDVLTSGPYDVTETITSGYVLTSISCDGGVLDPDNQIDLLAGTLTGLLVSPGSDIICTFVNAALGSLSVTKTAIGGDAMFNFDSSFGTFDITTTDGSGTEPIATMVAADTYQIWETEPLPTGWAFESATCKDGNDVTVDTVTVVANGVEFTQAAGQTTSCAFTNVKLATIVIEKVTNPDPPTNPADIFTFNHDPDLAAGTFGLVNGGSETILNVPVNADGITRTEYTIGEQDPATAYDLTGISCTTFPVPLVEPHEGDIDTGIATIRINAGETVTCEFTNTERASITIEKQISGDPGLLSTSFAFTSDVGAPFNLDPVNGPSDTTFSGLVPGQAYMVAETNPNAQGWALISATCGTGAESVNLSTGMVSNIIPVAGQAISCTFINAPLGSASIVKNAVGGEGIFGFTGALEPFNNGGAGFEIDTSVSSTADFTNMLLPSEIYDVREDIVPANWTLTDVTCADATGDSVPDGTEEPPADPALGAFIQAEVNETVTCTFTNEADATLTIEKVTSPASDVTTQFAFTGTGAITGNLVGGGSVSEMAPQGTFVADETPTAGWALTSIVCSGVSAGQITIGGTPGFVDGDTDVSVDLAPGDSATCTYTNTKLGSITMQKATVGDVGAFTFMGTDVDNDAGIITSPFVLSTDANDADPSSVVFNGLLPGQYLFSETVPTGWEIDGTQGDIECTGPDGFTSQWTPGSSSLDLTLANGEDLVCTFTNTRQATIIVEKTTDPTATTQGFSFTGDVSGGPIVNAGTLMTENLSPGTYSSTETAVAGWDLTDITCDDVESLNPSTGDTGTGVATFNAEAGEIVTCTFTNTIQRGQIFVDKVTDPTGSTQLFGFAMTGTNVDLAFQLADATTAYESGDLLPTSENGTYNVAETLPMGWTQSSATCDDGSDPAAVDLAPGEIVTCTFTNTITSGNIIVDKVTSPAGSTQSFDFVTNYGANGFSLTDTAQANDSGDLLPSSEAGVYTVSENATAGWVQTSAVCTGDGNTPEAITLLPGETVICTFTNTIQAGQIIVDKQTVPAASPVLFDFTLTGTNVDQAFQLADETSSYNSGDLLPMSENGVYNVGETLPEGWSSVSATCSDGSDPTAVDLSPAEIVTCTFVNALAGQSTFTKLTIGGDDTFMFSSQTPALNFSLTTVDGTSETLSSGMLEAGSYTLTEEALDGWELTDIVCTESDIQDSVVDIPTRTITLNVQDGESINCSVTNTKLGSITVSKATVPIGDATLFAFSGDVAGSIADGGAIMVSGLSAGAYTSVEAAAAGWDLTDISCDDGASTTPSTGDIATRTATFNLDAGEDVICTFTNSLPPPLLDILPVPVNDKLALLLLVLMMLASGWYFRPVTIRKL